MTRPTVVRIDPDRRARRNTQRAVDTNLAHCADIATAMIRTELTARAFIAARDLFATGLPAQSVGEPGSSGNGHGDPTASAAVANDWIARTIRQIHTDVEAAAALLAGARQKLGNLVAQTDTRPDVDPPGAGSCQRCQAYVTGSATDRVRSGFCGACYQAWRRAGNPDRSEFIAAHKHDPA